jgi:hypothetical protein
MLPHFLMDISYNFDMSNIAYIYKKIGRLNKSSIANLSEQQKTFLDLFFQVIFIVHVYIYIYKKINILLGTLY